MREFPELHQQGMMSFYPEAIPDNPLNVDFGLQVASDGRVWVCVNGLALIRFKPGQYKDGCI